MSDELLRLRAVSEIQAADVSCLLICLQQLTGSLRPHLPDLPDIGELFLRQRKLFLQPRLEALEDREPALAARLQEMIDASCKQFPFDYE